MKLGLKFPSGGAASDSPAVLVTLRGGADWESQDTPEKELEAIQVRATKMSRVLEKILHEPHGVPRWGINE